MHKQELILEKVNLSFVLSLSFVIPNLFSQTEVPGGSVSGIWALANSPYHITGDVVIEAGQTLIIEAGVLVESDLDVDIIVEGRLRVEGTRESMVHFTATDTANIWGGIDFRDSSNDDSFIVWARIEYAKEGIFFLISQANVDSSIIAHNRTGIWGDSNWPPDGLVNNFSAIDFYRNETGFLARHTFNSKFLNCRFYQNTVAGVFGRDHAGANDIITFERCLFYRNEVGITNEADRRTIELKNCTVTNNASTEVLLNTRSSSRPARIEESIIWGESVDGALEDGIVLVGNASADVSYSDISLFEGVFEGVGNINDDPLFADSENDDYSLREDSPCVDAGNPDSSLDPDGTPADMGALPFQRDPLIKLASESHDFGNIKKGDRSIFVLRVFNEGRDSTLTISNIAVNSLVFTVSRASFSIVPADSDTLKIDFVPNEFTTYDDVLTIHSNADNEPIKEFILMGNSPIPTDGTIVINSGSTRTNSGSVELMLSATGADSMKFAGDVVDGNVFVPFDINANVTLTAGDGIKTVNVIYKNIVGNEAPPVSDRIILDMTAPNAPTGLAAIADSGQVTLLWAPNTESDFLRYRIYGATSPNPTVVIDSTGSIADTTEAITKLSNGITYHFRMTAVDSANNESTFSGEVSATPRDDVRPEAPRNLQAAFGDRQITLTWNANTESDFLRYRIYSGTSPDPITKTDSVDGISNTRKVISNLINGTTYFFKLTAVDNSLLESDFSDEVSATPALGNVPPASPQNLQAASGDQQVTLTWNPNIESDFLRYMIYSGTASNPTSKIDSIDGISNTTQIVPDLTNGTTYFFRITAVDDALLESGFSNEVDATPNSSPPQITHSPVCSVLSGHDQIISAMITDNERVQSVTLFYRRGGSTSFASTDMTNLSDDTWQGSILASFITEYGVEYYFSAQDATNNITTFPTTNAETNPQVIQVTSSNLNFSSPDLAYRMISIPLDLGNPSPSAVLEDDLGSYNDMQWRFLRYVNGNHIEFPITGNLEPGRGFWLITRGAKSLDTGAGISVTTRENFAITLQPGWNQIGNPFAFSVNWVDVIRTASVENQLVGYQGTLNEPTGYDFTRNQLQPFQGYFVNNNSATPATIEIPALSATSASVTAKLSSPVPRVGQLLSNEWIIQLTAQSGLFLDKDNYLGVLYDASDGWDNNDFSEAPFFDNHVSLYFPHHDWETYSNDYTGDFRLVTDEGHFWDLRVRSNIANSAVVLTLAEIHNLPSDWEIMLLDKEIRISVNLREEKTYTFLGNEDKADRDFRILVGKAEFIESNDLDIAAVPEVFALSHNYPNPFNLATHIDYELATSSETRIAVFNLGGQHIQTLFDGKQNAGRYTASWDGRSESGRPAASGVYLVQIRAGEFVMTQKVILLK